ncbi:MAG: hypothetical protein ABJF10_09610 [Chthoniobacter sp.]|uniref:glycosyltransferase n=1 Tax=Chthoniobacter sp. TaxID=2510640 RepID=UPI0032A7055F
MKLAVLNPKGSDPTQDFADGAGVPGEQAHPPVSGHGFAACTGGTFFRKDQEVPAGQKEVLVLLQRNLKACRQAIMELRSEGKTVAIAWQEAGPQQIAEQLAKPAALQLFQEICQRVDGGIATTPDLMPFFTAAGVRHTEFIPTPYPIEDTRWDFATPIEERRGIFVGTRDFGTPSRNHLAALLALRQLASSMFESVTVINDNGWRGRGMLARLGYDERLLKVVEGRLPYPKYLRLLGQHKLVWQLDASGVPGQVAGDALLARVPCVGGNGTTERLVFPDVCGHGRDAEQLFDLAARLLEHPHDCETVMQRAQESAAEKVSFTAVGKKLETFFRRIAR